MASDYNMSSIHILGNQLADQLAERASTLYQVAHQDATDLLWYYGVCLRIQARALVILSHVIPERSAVPAAPPRVPRAVSTPIGVALFQTKHDISIFGPTMRCNMCFEQAPRLKEHIIDWLGSPCKVDRTYAYAHFTGSHRPVDLPKHRPTPIGRRLAHITHDLMTFKGLVFCKSCGYYAHRRMLRLANACTGMGEAARKRVQSLRRGHLPTGVRDWPNADCYRKIILN